MGGTSVGREYFKKLLIKSDLIFKWNIYIENFKDLRIIKATTTESNVWIKN